MDAPQSELTHCLPTRLRNIGYHDVAVHGSDGRIFDRRSWYPRIGFQEARFKQQFREENLSDCIGAFVGTCDTAIADWIGNRLRVPENDPQFIYWMTLNSHLPVPNPPALSSPASCSSVKSLDTHPALCAWFQLVFNVHQAVHDLATRDHERPTVFVLVGDHAPPFSDLELRNDFSYENVPYLVLIPKGLTQAGSHKAVIKPLPAKQYPRVSLE